MGCLQLVSPKNLVSALETLETIYMGASDSQIGPHGGHPNNITGWPRDGNHWTREIMGLIWIEMFELIGQPGPLYSFYFKLAFYF